MTAEGGPTVSAGGRVPTNTVAEPRSGSNLVGPLRSNNELAFVGMSDIICDWLASAIGRAICS